MNLNKVSIIGNLTADPNSRKLPSGGTTVSFTVATTYRRKDLESGEREERSEFHPVVAFGKLATIIEKYLKKGDRVYLEGRLTTRKWQDKDNRQRRTTEVVASQLIMLGGGRRSANAEVAQHATDEDEK